MKYIQAWLVIIIYLHLHTGICRKHKRSISGGCREVSSRDSQAAIACPWRIALPC